jgi:hypothetical protein
MKLRFTIRDLFWLVLVAARLAGGSTIWASQIAGMNLITVQRVLKSHFLVPFAAKSRMLTALQTIHFVVCDRLGSICIRSHQCDITTV